MRYQGFFMGVTLAVAGLTMPAPTEACSCVSDPIHNSDPASDARDVALNQAIMVEGVFRLSSVRLEDGEGNTVEIDVNEGPWPGCAGTSADVVPKVPLTPNTRYVVRVDPMYPEHLGLSQPASFSFTTGERMLVDDMLEPPPKAAASVLHSGPVAMCGAGLTTYTCLGIEESPGLELIMRKGDQVLLRTTTLVYSDGVYALDETPDCVELRRRAPTGERSDPVSICGGALQARAYEGADSDSPYGTIACRDGRIGKSADLTVDENDDDATEPPEVAGDAAAPPVGGARAMGHDSGVELDSTSNEHDAGSCSAVSSPAQNSCVAAIICMTLAFLAFTRRR